MTSGNFTTRLDLVYFYVRTPMITANIHEAKTHFSKLIKSVIQGEEVIIAKAGKPAAKIIPFTASKKKIHFGALKGKIRIAADFDAPLPQEIIDSFEG